MAKNETPLDIIDTMDVDYLLGILKSMRATKSVKAAALRRIRQIEQETGAEIYGNYN